MKILRLFSDSSCDVAGPENQMGGVSHRLGWAEPARAGLRSALLCYARALCVALLRVSHSQGARRFSAKYAYSKYDVTSANSRSRSIDYFTLTQASLK
jgi:hypothetical protein